jgi:hypothetical protein
LSAAGYGEYKPAAPNTSERNRALNRRVDIVLLSSDYSKFEPEGGTAAIAPPPEVIEPRPADSAVGLDEDTAGGGEEGEEEY